MHRLLAFWGNHTVPLKKMAVLPLLVVHLELAGGADPGAHDLAAVLGEVGIEVHGVRVAADALPFSRVEDGSRAGLAQDGDEVGHFSSKRSDERSFTIGLKLCRELSGFVPDLPASASQRGTIRAIRCVAVSEQLRRS